MSVLLKEDIELLEEENYENVPKELSKSFATTFIQYIYRENSHRHHDQAFPLDETRRGGRKRKRERFLSFQCVPSFILTVLL